MRVLLTQSSSEGRAIYLTLAEVVSARAIALLGPLASSFVRRTRSVSCSLNRPARGARSNDARGGYLCCAIA